MGWILLITLPALGMLALMIYIFYAVIKNAVKNGMKEAWKDIQKETKKTEENKEA